MNKQTIPALETAIRVLNAIATTAGETTSSALARKVEASQPTTYRILKTLEAADWIKANPNNGYSLSVGLLPLLRHLDDFTRFSRAAQPIIDDLSHQIDMTVKFSIRVSLEQVIVATAVPRKPYGVYVPLGGRYPIVWGSPGACLLAGLSDAEIHAIADAISEDKWKHETRELLMKRISTVRTTNASASFGEHYLGIDTLSIPMEPMSTPATLTIVGLRGGDLKEKSVPRFMKCLQVAAKEIEESLAHS